MHYYWGMIQPGRWVLVLGLLGCQLRGVAQLATAENEYAGKPIAAQRDVVDVAKSLFPGRNFTERDTSRLQRGLPLVWVIPQIGYSPQTGLLAQVLSNVALRRPGANVSTLISAIIYTQNNQLLFTNTLNLWLKQNRWNVTADLRVMHYPQSTYGLGMHTNTDRVVQMDYDYLRAYTTLLRRLAPNLYGGMGLQLDLHWAIRSYDARRERTAISRYTYGIEGRSVSAGHTLNLLYDNRPNAVNPFRGFYANAVFRNNLTGLGSDTDHQSLLIDVRKYISLPGQSDNTLAFWSYNTFTLSGNPPFLDLPATGWDTYNNIGRGYIQGRFRGKNLLYAEAEYRFGITANRLLGGVVFVNAQSISEPNLTPLIPQKPYFDRITPAAGLGLRLRMNKLSRTNLAIDYGFGADGSQGLYFNLGEVF